LVELNDEIEPYEKTLNKMKKNERVGMGGKGNE